MNFYKNKNILITGHTGFKGTWLSRILTNFGANVTGYSLESPTKPSLFELIQLEDYINHIIGDIRDLKYLKTVFEEINPEIVIHMAAQPLVRYSYDDPVYTYETNIMGTVNILECIKDSNEVKSFLNVTTDKVYENKEWIWGYRENERLCGQDPYSNSKSCSELVTHSYKKSFFSENETPAISTARSGNVIGGGDFAKDRIIPDCVRSAEKKETIKVRNPNSIRPYQHVLECLSGYLVLTKKQYSNKSLEGSYNFGPDDENCVTTGDLVDAFCSKWGEQNWIPTQDSGPHEASYLKLDCSKAKTILGWNPKWDLDTTIEKLVEWSKIYINNGDIIDCLDNQINQYFK